MASSLIGALRVALGLDTAAFDTGASQAEKRAEQLGQRIGAALRAPIGAASALSGAVAALGGAALLTSLAALAKRGLEYASSLDEVSQQLGVTSKDLQEYRYAASQVGISNDEMDKSLSKLTVAMGKARDGVQAPADAFKTLSNLLGKDILKSSMTAGDAIPLIADALAKIPDPTKRAALELELFGKTGQKLDTLLSGGSAAIDQMRQTAQDLGIVLSEKEIQDADKAADKITELQQALSIHIAAAVADNAGAIFNFVDSIEKLLVKLPVGISYLKQFFATVQQYQGKFHEIEGNANVVAGHILGGALVDRKAQIARGQAEAAQGRHEQSDAQASISDARLDRSLARLGVSGNGLPFKSATIAPFKPTGAGQTPGDRSAAAKAKAEAAKAAREAEQQRKKELADQRAYDADLGRTRSEYLRAQEQLTPEIVEQASLEKDQLKIETDARIQSIETNEKYSRAQKDELEGYEQKIAALKSDAIDREKIAKLQQQSFTSAQSERDNQSDVLRAQEDLARTAKERRDIELKLLDLSYQSQIAQQDFIIASKDSTKAQVADAEARKKSITDAYGYQRQGVIRSTMGPLDSYLDSIPKSADQINESLQSVAVDGLQGLNDGIVSAITNAKSLGDVFSNVAKQIVADLAKIAIEKAVIAPLGNALSGLLGGGGLDISANTASVSAGLGSSISSGWAGILPGRASGGSVVGKRNYLVGEEGPEIFTPDHSGSIIANDDIPMSQKGFTQHITYSGAVDVADKPYVQQMAIQAAAATKTALREESRRAAGRG